MSIKDKGIVEKMQHKLEKNIDFDKYLLKF